MGIKKWLLKNTDSLFGKTVAVTGSTGGLGKELCRHLAHLGASLVLLNRSEEKTKEQMGALYEEYPGCVLSFIPLDLEDIASVKAATDALGRLAPDYIIHNAGAYSIPRRKCEGGLDNVFQINFASPYYMTRELLPLVTERGGRVIFVGSIAHNYSKIDESDLDFSTRGRASLVYGNAKRHLMYSAFALSEKYSGTVSVTHPGITFTNITAHYPKLIFALIKHPMKLIFTRPRKASLSILKGIFDPTLGCRWIGPRVFNIWGYPSKKKLATASESEIKIICQRAEDVYQKLKNI